MTFLIAGKLPENSLIGLVDLLAAIAALSLWMAGSGRLPRF
jgi:hypothetical protein